MKKIIILLATIILSVVSLYAQEQAKYRITYDSEGDLRTPSKSRQYVRWALDIGNTTAAFYCPAQRMLEEELKNTKSGNSLADVYKLSDKYKHRQKLQILWHSPQKNQFTYMNNMFKNIKYSDTLPKIEWQLCEGEATVCEYKCKIAKGTVFGRTWTVYYTKEIPLSYGPWILGGLPGLVLKAFDSDNLFIFEAVGIENITDGSLVKMTRTEKAIDCKTRKKYVELRNHKDASPDTFLQSLTGIESKSYDENGKPMNYAERLNEVTFNYLDK